MNIFNEGYRAATHGKMKNDNPYNHLTEKLKYEEWLEGFLIGEIEDRELYLELSSAYEF